MRIRFHSLAGTAGGWLLAAAAALFLSALVVADTVTLKGGERLSGTVLKETEQAVYIDVGFDVLRVPADQVLVVEKGAEDAEGETPGAEAEIREKEGAEWQLYRQAELPLSTIEDCSERFGEAVVMVTSPDGLGSGFFIAPDGYLITNYHVIARETKIEITVFERTDRGFERKRYKKVRIVAINPYVDLALLKVEDEREGGFTFAYLGEMDALKVGEQVFAIGNPLGLTRSVSQGIVSTKNRDFEGRLYIQTTADVNPGNSGGPLFNLRGEVIGVTSMGYLFLSGLNFAIPADVVKRFVENRDAFAYDQENPNTGYRYLQPPGRSNWSDPPLTPGSSGEDNEGPAPPAEEAEGGAPPAERREQ